MHREGGGYTQTHYQVAGSLQAESTDSEDGAEMIEESGGLASEASIHIMDNDDEVEVCDPSVGATKVKHRCCKRCRLIAGCVGATQEAVPEGATTKRDHVRACRCNRSCSQTC
jgi:hypothetical protein